MSLGLYGKECRNRGFAGSLAVERIDLSLNYVLAELRIQTSQSI